MWNSQVTQKVTSVKSVLILCSWMLHLEEWQAVICLRRRRVLASSG